MLRTLIVYGTTDGHTVRIVDRLTARLERLGHAVTVYRGDVVPGDLDLNRFDGFLLAGSVRFGRHQKYLRNWARRHALFLNTQPSAMLSVCGAMIGDTEAGREEAAGYLKRFREETGWYPDMARSAAGALLYRRYNPLLRLVMKRISRKAGHTTDTSRNHDLTDWEAIDRFAEAFDEMLPVVTAGRVDG